MPTLAVKAAFVDRLGCSIPDRAFYFDLVREFLAAAPSARAIVAEVNAKIMAGDLYKALRAARQLVVYEAELVQRAKEVAA